MNFILKFYYAFPTDFAPGILRKVLNKVLAVLADYTLNAYYPNYLERTSLQPENSLALEGLDRIPEEELIIVSLTSFPARIDTSHLSIECLMRQSVKPHKIILWLAKEQFPEGLEGLPEKLLQMRAKGLEIRFTNDIRSHKKYFYSLLEYPNSKIVTFDDDLYYHKDAIKNLVELHAAYPGHIVANRCHQMRFDEDGNMLPYTKWHHNYNKEQPSYFLMHTSGAGVLFDGKSMLHAQTYDESLIKELSPNSDDVWLKISLLMNRKKVVTNNVFTKDFIAVRGSNLQTGDTFINFRFVFSHMNLQR